MNPKLRALGILLLTALFAVFACVHPVAGFFCAILIGACALKGAPQPGMLCDPTLIIALLTFKVIEAFKTLVPEISFFSTDFGKQDGKFAPPVKFGQAVISQMAIIPTVSDHVPGNSLSAGAQSAAALVSDVSVVINRCKKVVIKIASADASTLMVDAAFQSALREGGKALGRAVVLDAINTVRRCNFSQETVEASAGFDFDTLDQARQSLNDVGALTPRYMLGSSAAIGNISRDTRVTSGDYFGQLTEADPYVSLKNIAGFTEVREFPSFPTNNNVMGTFTATGSSATLTCTPSAIAQAIEPLSTGDRVQVSNVGGALPTGLSANTDYFVVNPVATIGSPVPSLTNYTFQLSATLGGSAISPSAAGTGVNTVTLLENLNAFAFEKRAIHIAVRQMMDALDIAKGLGIPVPVAYHTETDAVTGLTFSSFMWINTDTHDIYVAIVVMYGIETGRGLKGSADPGSLAAGTALDYAGLRIPETATNV